MVKKLSVEPQEMYDELKKCRLRPVYLFSEPDAVTTLCFQAAEGLRDKVLGPLLEIEKELDEIEFTENPARSITDFWKTYAEMLEIMTRVTQVQAGRNLNRVLWIDGVCAAKSNPGVFRYRLHRKGTGFAHVVDE